MIKVKMEHVNAVVHAELFVDAAIEKAASKRIQHSLENDLLRLAELKFILIQKLTGTGDLFNGDGKRVTPPSTGIEENDGDTNQPK